MKILINLTKLIVSLQNYLKKTVYFEKQRFCGEQHQYAASHFFLKKNQA